MKEPQLKDKEKVIEKLQPFWKNWEKEEKFRNEVAELEKEMSKEVGLGIDLEFFHADGECVGIDAMHMPHICSDCTDKMGDALGNGKMGAFIKDVNKQMEKMGENNAIAEEIAEEITNENIDALLDELEDADASEEDKIKEAFYRGVWMTLFLIGNNHEPGFLEKEAEGIKDFHKHMKEREEQEAEAEDDEEEMDEDEEEE